MFSNWWFASPFENSQFFPCSLVKLPQHNEIAAYSRQHFYKLFTLFSLILKQKTSSFGRFKREYEVYLSAFEMELYGNLAFFCCIKTGNYILLHSFYDYLKDLFLGSFCQNLLLMFFELELETNEFQIYFNEGFSHFCVLSLWSAIFQPSYWVIRTLFALVRFPTDNL